MFALHVPVEGALLAPSVVTKFAWKREFSCVYAFVYSKSTKRLEGLVTIFTLVLPQAVMSALHVQSKLSLVYKHFVANRTVIRPFLFFATVCVSNMSAVRALSQCQPTDGTQHFGMRFLMLQTSLVFKGLLAIVTMILVHADFTLHYLMDLFLMISQGYG